MMIYLRWGWPLVLAAALISCGRPAPWNRHIDPALDKLIPADTTMLVAVHLARLGKTPAWQKYLSPMASREMADLRGRTGIDFTRDLDEFLISSDGRNIVTLIRGRLNPSDAASRLRGAGLSGTSYNGTEIWEQGRTAIAFLDNATAAAGTEAAVRSILDQRRRGGGGVPAALRPVVEAIPAKDQIWAATAGGIPTLRMEGNLQNLAELARSIDHAWAGVDLRNGLDLEARADCRSPEDARRVHDALRGVIALARMAAPANRGDLIRVYDAISVVRENDQVRVTASLGEYDLEAFLNLLPEHR